MSSTPNPRPASKTRFSPGQFLSTPGALEILARYQVDPITLLSRHLSGDWGEVCPEDAKANEDALLHGARIFSVYVLPSTADEPELNPVKLWVITEADRRATTILLPEEY